MGQLRKLTAASVPVARTQEDQLDAAHAQGWRDAAAALCDTDRYMDWWESSGVKPDEPARYHLARYLEAVAPDVTVPASEVAPGGCDDCSVEPGERHRYAACPGNRRRGRQSAPVTREG
jgi:hypothetical protein